jgi:hypothetical protein
MHRYIHILVQTLYITLLIICMAGLTSCATLGGYPQDPETDDNLQALKAAYFAPNSKCECAYNELRLKYKESRLPADADALKAMRDEIVLSRVHVYDMEFSRFQRLLAGSSNVTSVGSDFAILTLNGLAAVTGGTATKSALSAASGGIVGAQGNVNKDLFYQKTIPAIISQMEANRAKVKLTIFEGLKLPDDQYPLQRTESDLADLNDAGSIPAAISSVTQAATDSKNENQDLIKATFAASTSAQKIRSWLYTGGKVDQSRLEALQAWLDKNTDTKVQGIPAALLATGEGSVQGTDLEDVRKRALEDPTLKIPN